MTKNTLVKGDIMWNKQEIFRAAAAIITGLAFFGILRLIYPPFNYFPPEELISKLERSWFVNAGLRKVIMAGFGTVALVMMAIFFKAVQKSWPGYGSLKGLAFGSSVGIVWSFGFLTGWMFLGTTLRAEILNSVIDIIALAFGGWLIGKAIGQDVPMRKIKIWKPWLVVFLTAIGFVSIHKLAVTFLAGHVGLAADLLLVPETLPQYVLLIGLGSWAGIMFAMLRRGLSFESIWANAALFAFGVFGHSWIWFQMFLVIVDFSEGLLPVLFISLIDALGVFIAILCYEVLLRKREQAD